ncbi:MAG: response regulator [Proteobacteria bacterium]|nr:response regulator [Pseudomonadota bacterium]
MGRQTNKKNGGHEPTELAKTTEFGAVEHGPKIVLIDDDPVFIAIMKRWAELEKIKLETYESLDEMGFIGLLSNYDVAILDYDLGYTTGIEIANCTQSLLKDMPIIIVSYKDRSKECANAPSCVKAVLQKSKGYNHILNVARNCCQQYKARL